MDNRYTDYYRDGDDEPGIIIWSLIPDIRTYINLLGKVFGEPPAKPAMLRSTNLSEANLSAAELHGAKYDSQTKWPEGFDLSATGAVNLDI